MPFFALFLSLFLSPSFAAEKKKEAKGDETVQLVEYFLKTPTADLAPDAVPHFLAVDPAKLPARLREGCQAKRLELLALKKNADGKYKPPLRLLGKEGVNAGCEAPKEMQSIRLLLQFGFEEITQQEEERLMEDTNCQECELRTEFSLDLILTPPKKKGGKKELHYLLHQGDPLMTLIGGYRAGARPKTTSFFGIGGNPKCR